MKLLILATLALVSVNTFAMDCQLFKGPGVSEYLGVVKVQSKIRTFMYGNFHFSVDTTSKLMKLEIRDMNSRASAAIEAVKFADVKLTNPQGESMTLTCAKDEL